MLQFKLKPRRDKRLPANQGFSIIEVLIATLVVGVTLTAVVLTLTYSIKSNALAAYRQTAAKKAQEGIDYYRRERVILGWEKFISEIGANYCLVTVPSPAVNGLPTFGIVETCDGHDQQYEIAVNGVGTRFKREVVITKSDEVSDQWVNIQVTVSWPSELANSNSVTLTQKLSQW